MGVDLRKGDDGEERPPAPAAPAPPRASGSTSRGDVDRLPDRSLAGTGSSEVVAAQPWLNLPAPAVGFITAAWPALWILMFIFGPWQVALVLLFLTGPVMALLHGKHGQERGSRRQRRLERHQRRHELSMAYYRDRALKNPDRALGHQPEREAPPAAVGPPPTTASGPPPGSSGGASATSAAERSLAATLVRAETSADRLDPQALSLVREVDVLLRPLLARVRASGADAQVQRDLDTLATEHLPAALEAYLRLPADYAREHRNVSGTTPTDELRSQLTLLVEGCRQLRDAVHDADLNRQQELSRFLEAKFRRSDLDL